MADGIKDETGGKVGDDSIKEILTPEMKASIEAGQKVSEMLKVHGVESIEDLDKNLKGHSEIIKALGDKDLAAVLEKAGTLDKYETYWAEQDGKKIPTADDTLDDDEKRDKEITALKTEIQAIKDGKLKEVNEATSKREAQEALDGYTKEINTFLKDNDIPEEYADHIKRFFGLDNPFNEVDISDQVEIRKMFKNGLPKVQEFEQAIIKRYLDGKIKIPEMSETKPVDPNDNLPKPKNLKEAGNVAKELLTKAFRGGRTGQHKGVNNNGRLS